MTSNYLHEKYPEENYKQYDHSDIDISTIFDFKSITKNLGKKKTVKPEIEPDTREYLNCTHVCECGNEWESFEKYEKGYYPYIEGVCSDCLQKEREAKKLEQFYENIPPRYRNKLKDPIHAELEKAICSIVWGGFGTGKTWECYSLIKKMITTNQIKTFKLITEIDLLNDLKASFDNMQWKIDNYKKIDLLILDEAGKNNDSDFNKAQLFGILNHRYDWEKKTILICNAKSKQEIRELLPTATLDRFRECVVEMNGSSKRYKGE